MTAYNVLNNDQTISNTVENTGNTIVHMNQNSDQDTRPEQNDPENLSSPTRTPVSYNLNLASMPLEQCAETA